MTKKPTQWHTAVWALLLRIIILYLFALLSTLLAYFFMFSSYLCPHFLLLETFSRHCLSPKNLVDSKLRGQCRLAAGNSTISSSLWPNNWQLKKKKKKKRLFKINSNLPSGQLLCCRVCFSDWPLSAEAPQEILVSDTQPDSGKHPSPLNPMFLSVNTHTHTHSTDRKNKWSLTVNHMSTFFLVSLLCLLSVQQLNRQRNNAECSNAAARLCVQNKQTPQLFK